MDRPTPVHLFVPALMEPRNVLIGAVIESMGLNVVQPDGDLVLATIAGGKIRHIRTVEVADRELTGEVYMPGAVFKTGSVDTYGGRVWENVERVYWLQCDADLSDYITTYTKEEVQALSPEDMMTFIEMQKEDLLGCFGDLGLRPQRIDYTGHGLCAYFYIHPSSQRELARLKAIHKRLVQRFNEASGVERFLDPQVSDAGTRITRIPGSYNLKGPIRRQVETLEYIEDFYTVDRLEELLGAAPPPTRLVPRDGKRLDANVVEMIVSHMSSHWSEGQRHVLALGLSGMLAKAGVPRDQCLHIMEQISSGDDESQDRVKAVSTSYARYASGRETRGFYGLKQYLPVDFVSWLDGELEKIRPRANVTFKVHSADAEKPQSKPIPQGAFHGWFKQYLDLVEPTTEASDVFHLGSSLAIASVMIGRRISMEYSGDDLFPSLFVALVGPSGSSRKDTAIKRALNLTQVRAAVGGGFLVPEFKIARDVSSGEGLIEMLKNQPNTLLYLSELSVLLKNARRKGTTTILDRLIEVWDVPTAMENRSKMASNTADTPFLSIIAATQPDRIASEILPEDIHSGFANRWLFLPGVGKSARPNPPRVNEHEAEQLQRQFMRSVMSYDPGYVLTMDSEADAYWAEWYIPFTDAMDSYDDDTATMQIRIPVQIQKVAMIYAIGDQSPHVTMEHLAPAQELIEWSWDHVSRMMKQWGIGLNSQIERRIEDVLMKKGAMKKRDLTRMCSNRKWSSTQFWQVFQAMRDTGQIVVDPGGMVGLPDDSE